MSVRNVVLPAEPSKRGELKTVDPNDRERNQDDPSAEVREPHPRRIGPSDVSDPEAKHLVAKDRNADQLPADYPAADYLAAATEEPAGDLGAMDANQRELEQRLEDVLRVDSHSGLRNVQIHVHDNNGATLTGTVRSYYLKQMAQERVRQVCPNIKLRNQLVVPRSS